MQPSLQEVQRRLSMARDGLSRRYPIRRIGIFGSTARGEAGPESDVDVLVEFSEPVGFEVADLAEELEILLDCRVDLVTSGAVREAMRHYVERDLVYV